VKGGLSKEVVSGEGDLIWGTNTSVTSKTGLTKGAVIHKGGFSKGGTTVTQTVLLYST
jgi:hypothetical protein